MQARYADQDFSWIALLIPESSSEHALLSFQSKLKTIWQKGLLTRDAFDKAEAHVWALKSSSLSAEESRSRRKPTSRQAASRRSEEEE